MKIFCSCLWFDVAPQAPPQSSYGNNWNWNMPQNGPAAATGPPGQSGPGPQSKAFQNNLKISFYLFILTLSDDMYSRSAGAAPATGPTPPGTAPQKAGDYAGYGNYAGYQQV